MNERTKKLVEKAQALTGQAFRLQVELEIVQTELAAVVQEIRKSYTAQLASGELEMSDEEQGIAEREGKIPALRAYRARTGSTLQDAVQAYERYATAKKGGN